ncbi:aminotransferase class I/II-fold pyridoxal phosphate-dependent enzyme [Aminithiophilus ramosus]|uniref:Aminotransferase class I/II-fold pyridoxal phosphate-dependent enzyme n=2 Tax=Aminithiophilus ramosus TaxID=3029084 RepID=A0A9Q7F1D7_9BACT|nr:aminotransferase class I/II-fold pyridoxal phosphate-dependent enzyme [Aminithiophilus ramosus]
MTGREMDYIKEAFDSNWIAPLGPHVDAFEREMADYVGVSGALALSSGTAALHLALKLAGVERGDRVFCSDLTFAATVNPVFYEGAEPVFIDAEPESWNLSPLALERAFADAEREGRLPKAVVAADLYGQSADYGPIEALCDRYGVPLVEDAAEALGATYRGKKCGALGRWNVLSFNGNKIITTSGGGMLLSDDVEGLAKARFWATQARDKAPWYQHSEIGYNYRMSNLLAAVGRAQLGVIEDRVAARRAVFDRYVRELGELPGISFMPEASFGRHNRWLTVALVDQSRAGVSPLDLMGALEKENIESRPLWKPMHLQPVFEAYPFYSHDHEGDSAVSASLFDRGLCLPSGSSLSEPEQERIVQIIRSGFKGI